jgi:uncharacterized membrane protein
MAGMAEIVWQNSLALLALPVLWLLIVVFAWRRRFKPFGAFLLRLAIIVLVALALARPTVLPPAAADDELQERLVLLVDQSASLQEWEQQIFRTETVRLTEQFPDTVVLYFAHQPVMVSAFNLPLEGAADWERLGLNPEASSLAQALSIGAEMLNGQPGRLVLFSDGIPTEGDVEEAIAQLDRQNIPVDVFISDGAGVAPQSVRPNEVRLIELSVPSVLRLGETFDVEVFMHTVRETEVKLTLTQDNARLGEDTILLEPGLNRFILETRAEEIGPHTFRAIVTTDDDGQPANNSFSAFSQVYPAPRILVVGDDGQAAYFAEWLTEAGFIPERIGSKDLPDQLSLLEPYAGMVLVNMSARPLELEQMIAVQEFVRSLGRGLVVTGGRSSFSLGRYEDTPLAELLPLSLDPPIREERPPVALLLVIDHSGSMVEERGELATRLVMAKEAAIRATNILAPQDLIGILIFDNEYEWIVPFKRVSDGAALLEIQQDIANITGGGGTRVLRALEIGIPALIEQQAIIGAGHAVLFSDGKSYDGKKGIEDYDLVVDAALGANITLSTISIGASTDEELLAYLAERGRGRYHYASVPEELPELTIAESDILRSSAVQEGDYDPAAPAPHSILRGFSTISTADSDSETLEDPERMLPAVSGYIAMTPKPQAEVALQAGPGDPLLGVWGYGLGRVAAWSSDTGNEWATNWRSWPEASRFWGQVVGYTLPAPDLGLLQLKAEVESNGVVTLMADGVTITGQTVDLSRTQATLTTPGGREIPLNLRQVAPGRYQQQVRLSDSGVYQLSVNQTRADESNETATIGFVVPYPTEYGLPDEGAGEPLLRQIAAATGGRTFSREESLLPNASSSEITDTLQEPLELWPWLLLTALILWPIEIAWRRWGRLRIQ